MVKPTSHWSPAPVTSEGPRLIWGGDPSPSTPQRPASVPEGWSGRGPRGGGRGGPGSRRGPGLTARGRQRVQLLGLLQEALGLVAVAGAQGLASDLHAFLRLVAVALHGSRLPGCRRPRSCEGGPPRRRRGGRAGRGAARRGEERAPRRRRRPGDGRPRSSASSRPPPRPPRPQRRQPRPCRACCTPGPAEAGRSGWEGVRSRPPASGAAPEPAFRAIGAGTGDPHFRLDPQGPEAPPLGPEVWRPQAC